LNELLGAELAEAERLTPHRITLVALLATTPSICKGKRNGLDGKHNKAKQYALYEPMTPSKDNGTGNRHKSSRLEFTLRLCVHQVSA
jgi:hypothetical protein